MAAESPEEWTTRWVETHGDAIVRYLAGYVGDPNEAQDLAQDVFSRVYRQRRDHPRADLTVAWLYTVARRLAIDHHRSQQARLRDALARDPIDEDPAWALGDPTPSRRVEPGPLSMEERLAVRDMLERLPPGDRDCLVLFYFQDWPLDAVAQALQLTPATVRVRLHRAREHFRRLWQEEGRHEGDGQSGGR